MVILSIGESLLGAFFRVNQALEVAVESICGFRPTSAKILVLPSFSDAIGEEFDHISLGNVGNC